MSIDSTSSSNMGSSNVSTSTPADRSKGKFHTGKPPKNFFPKPKSKKSMYRRGQK